MGCSRNEKDLESLQTPVAFKHNGHLVLHLRLSVWELNTLTFMARLNLRQNVHKFVMIELASG